MKNTILLIVLLVFLAAIMVFFVTIQNTASLISPASFSREQSSNQHPLASPSVPSYNPPREIKYGSSTDLGKELDSINPEVLDSDF